MVNMLENTSNPMIPQNPLVPRFAKIAKPKKLHKSTPAKMAIFTIPLIFASPRSDLWISILRIIDFTINRKL